MSRPAASARTFAERRGRCAGSMHGVDHEVIGARSNAAAQFRPQFLRDMMGVRTVADDLRANEDDQLRAGSLLVLMPEGVAQMRNFIQQRNAVAVAVLLLADQSGEEYG